MHLYYVFSIILIIYYIFISKKFSKWKGLPLITKLITQTNHKKLVNLKLVNLKLRINLTLI